MADLVEVVLNGRDNTGPAFQSMAANTSRATSHMKAMGASLSTFGNVAANVGQTHLANLIGQTEMLARSGEQVIKSFAGVKLAVLGAFGAVAAAAAAAYALGMKHFEEMEEAAKKKIAAMDTLIKAVQLREDLMDPAGKAARDVSRNAASQIQGVKASGADPEAQASAIRQLQILKEMQLEKLRADAAIESSNKRMEAEGAAVAQQQEWMKALNEQAEVFNKQKLQDGEAALVMGAKLRADALEGIEQAIALSQIALDAELQRINALLVAEGEKRTLTQLAEAAHQAKLRQLNQDRAEREIQLEKQAAASKAQLQAQYVQAASNAFGNLANAARASGKKGFAAYKAFATAQAIIDTYKAANAAYGALAGIPIIGPALGIAAAAAAIAAGLANVAQIQSAEPAGAFHGGIDYVPAGQSYLLEQGERVVQEPANRDLTEFLEGNGSGGQPIHISIDLDGRTLYNGITHASQDGRLKIAAKAII
jgi:hypothetical protein